MRYEDETQIVRAAPTCATARPAQIEAVVTDNEIAFRPRRQLIVTIDDGSDTCQLRFFNFYPSQQKQLAVARGCGRAAKSARLPRRGRWCTRPTRPPGRAAAGCADAGLSDRSKAWPQPVLRREIARGLARAVTGETRCPPAPRRTAALGRFEQALRLLHYPPPDVDDGHAGGPQPSGLAADEVRRTAGAAAVALQARRDARRASARRRSTRPLGRLAARAASWPRCRSR